MHNPVQRHRQTQDARGRDQIAAYEDTFQRPACTNQNSRCARWGVARGRGRFVVSQGVWETNVNVKSETLMRRLNSIQVTPQDLEMVIQATRSVREDLRN